MKILYIAVHHHVGWGAEHWLANAFERAGQIVERFDYRTRRKRFKPWALIRRELSGLADTFGPDIVLIQRGENMPASIGEAFSVPVVFWSTEPLNRRRDTDKMLKADNAFDWLYVHTYTCMSVIEKEFSHLLSKSSVMHNAGAVESRPGDLQRPRFAIFNRNISQRRQIWLSEVDDLVEIISGHYGDPYFDDLRASTVAINIHYADESVDDFETGIFEALACGCVVVTETLNPQTVADMNMQDAVVQVDCPKSLRKALLDLQSNPEMIEHYRKAGLKAIDQNRWDARAQSMLSKFESLIV